LVDCKEIYVGLRDNNGIVKNIKIYNVADIGEKFKDIWDYEKLEKFLSDVLARVKNDLKAVVDSDVSYRYALEPKTGKKPEAKVEDFKLTIHKETPLFSPEFINFVQTE
jgi:hypothetical protein